MVQIVSINMASRGWWGRQKSLIFCLSVTFLNGKVCANDIDLKPFEFGNGC